MRFFIQYKIRFSCVILLAWLSNGPALGQYQNIWMPPGINFNGGSPVVEPFPITRMLFGEASAMICDENGDLLIVTNGDEVWGKDYILMPNGENLLPVPGFPNPTQSSLQGTVIVPMPGSDSRYYIFSLTALTGGADTMPGYLYYSIVDINLNNGLGDVEPSTKGVFIDSGYIEGITAVVGDRCNIWLLARAHSDGSLHAYEITEDGFNSSPVVSSLITPGYILGYIKAAPDRKKLLLSDMNYHLVDFDPVSGIASNIVTLLPTGTGGSLLAAHVPEFSPDNSKLYAYVPNTDSCYQFDLTATTGAAIFDSRVALFEGGDYVFNSFKLGPDEKIYIVRDNSRLDRINQPNLVGLACDIQVDVLSTGNINRNLTSLAYGGPNAVPIITRDTFLTSQQQSAGCFASRVVVSAQDTGTGWDYVWNTGINGSEAIADTPGTYWVTYHTPPCNYHVDTFHVDFPNGVLPTIYTSAECRSDSNGFAYATTYPGDPVTYSYTWIRDSDTLSVTDTLSDVPSGSYSLHVQTNSGCDTLLFFDIPEEDFRVSFEVSDTLICVGDTIELANTSDAHFSTYHWALGNGDTTNVANPPAYVYPESGAYCLMLVGGGEICKDTAYQAILVDQTLFPAFEIIPQAVCVGQQVYFYPRTDSTTVQLALTMEGQQRIEKGVQARYQHSFTSSGIFPVTLKVGSRACPDTNVTDSVRVYPFPEIDLGGDSSICLNGQPVYLRNLREAPIMPYHQVWSTGDTTKVLKVVHPGFYTLRVTTEPIGCSTTESIAISKDCYIDIPNAFTPNGDGHNDYFMPRQLLTDGLVRFRMQVYNRWGQLIFESNQLNGRGWNGCFNDKVQPMGVYLYRVEATFANGRQEKYQGDVTLIR